jgi:molybdopterin-guanine dinucleotide biosynthesis protein A
MILTEHNHHHSTIHHHFIEIGIWGIGCTALQQLYYQLSQANKHIKIGYHDVKHETNPENTNTLLQFSNVELQLPQNFASFQSSQFFNNANVVIVNGNHHQANKMWLILDGKKDYKPNYKNLQKTSVIFCNHNTAVLAKQLQQTNTAIEIIDNCDFECINQYFTIYFKKLKPKLCGLILTGGASTRMKENKSLIVYHQQPQWLHLFDMLNSFCEETYVSCTEKNSSIYQNKPIVTDTFLGFGPLSGILSALMKFKNKAILVLACDLPLINEDTIKELIEARDISKMATTFLNPESNFLEPLITIYEPKALPIMLSMLAQGYQCPRKMLMQNEVKIIHPKNASSLKNINHPDEKNHIIQMLQKSIKI